jgi:hypothetical protein
MNPNPVEVSKDLGGFDLPAGPIPVKIQRLGTDEVFASPALLKVDIVLDPKDAGAKGESMLPVPWIKGFLRGATVPLFHGIVQTQKRFIVREKLKMVPEFMGQRLPDFLLP